MVEITMTDLEWVGGGAAIGGLVGGVATRSTIGAVAGALGGAVLGWGAGKVFGGGLFDLIRRAGQFPKDMAEVFSPEAVGKALSGETAAELETQAATPGTELYSAVEQFGQQTGQPDLSGEEFLKELGAMESGSYGGSGWP